MRWNDYDTYTGPHMAEMLYRAEQHRLARGWLLVALGQWMVRWGQKLITLAKTDEGATL